MKMVWPKGSQKWCRGPRHGPPGNRGTTGENKVLQGQTTQCPLVAGFLVSPESAPCLLYCEMVVEGNSCDDRGMAWASRPQLAGHGQSLCQSPDVVVRVDHLPLDSQQRRAT
jgi:hypothetical protein